jgi:hypothetical protein
MKNLQLQFFKNIYNGSTSTKQMWNSGLVLVQFLKKENWFWKSDPVLGISWSEIYV